MDSSYSYFILNVYTTIRMMLENAVYGKKT